MTKKINTLSLFSGAGGLDIGFHQAGFNIIACVEIEPAYSASLKANTGENKYFGPGCEIHCEDIRNFDPEIYRNAGIDCIIGGPPCQTFSAAGRRSGGVVGTRDERGRLFETYCEILKIIKPRVFLFENVYGIVGANDGEPWAEILHSFNKLGYKLRYEVLDAADYGVPQHRERLIIIGHKENNFEFPLPTHGADSATDTNLVSVIDAIGDIQDAAEPAHAGIGGLYGHLLPDVPEGLNYAFFTAEMGHPEPQFAWRSKFHDLLYKVNPQKPCRTIKAQPGKFTGPFHWKNRHFNISELKRLQSFPDEYELVGSYGKIVEQIGNSVPPRMAYVLATSVREQLFEHKQMYKFPLRNSDFISTFRKRQRMRSEDFKAIAQEAILRKYGKPAIENRYHEEKIEKFYLKIKNYFDHQKIKKIPKSTSDFLHLLDVDITHRDNKLHIESKIVSEKEKIGVSIVVKGLAKYVGTVDEVELTGEICFPGEIFYLWTNVENSLVERSRFFTLIDIYGHYANRGDTISITTSIENVRTDVEKGINFFGKSQNCGKFIDINSLCETLSLSKLRLRKMVSDMRDFRFDIRTDETHPIIGRDQIICTYPFPLLSPRALVKSKVQFIKEESNADQLNLLLA